MPGLLIKTFLPAASVVLTLAATCGGAFADPDVGELNREQVAVSALETLIPASRAAFAREQPKPARRSTFGTPGSYSAPSAPFQSGDARRARPMTRTTNETISPGPCGARVQFRSSAAWI